jgi:heme-degrading monooxygenase HmoA
MAYLIVHHTVEDYAAWKLVFDGHASSRKEHGSKGAQVLRSAQNPNEIVIITEWDNLHDARAFASSPGLREAMQNAGVVGRPEVLFLNEVERQPA